MNIETFEEAFHTRNPHRFVEIICPSEWGGIKHTLFRLCDRLRFEHAKWFPGKGVIPLTTRGEASELPNMIFRSVVFRFHDFLHQIWPADISSKEAFVRSQIDGELVVLALAEASFIPWLNSNSNCPLVKEYCAMREVMLTNYPGAENFTKTANSIHSLISPYNGHTKPPVGDGELFFAHYFRKMLRHDFRWSQVNSTHVPLMGGGKNSGRMYGENPFNEMISDVEKMLQGEVLDVKLHHDIILPREWK